MVVEILAGSKACRPFRLETTVVPDYLNLRHCNLRHIVPGREHELDHLGIRRRLRKNSGGACLSLNRILEVQCLEYRMENMAGHIAESAGTEIPPTAEIPRRIDGVVRSHRSRSDEAVPIES